MVQKFAIGQRWISEPEPELGLGIITFCDNRFVEINFPSQKIKRKYSAASAPLKRIIFNPGDTIQDSKGTKLIITDIIEDNHGYITYQCSTITIGEADLPDVVNISSPEKRLLAGIVENFQDFDLRYELLKFQSDIAQSEIRGFVGGRIDLIAHQLFVASASSSRKIPRILLADETGLGKTIEACLVIHRLLLTGKISRVIVLVPETLIHQWFVELLRKFNLNFRIFSKEFGSEISEVDNPFLEDELFICSIDLLAAHNPFAEAAVKAGWDMVVIDEAHHAKVGGPQFSLIQNLSRNSSGLLLLSATPEQYGKSSHFARLQLLDPHRFTSFQKYQKESDRMQLVSHYIDKWSQTNSINLNTVSPDMVTLPLPSKICELLTDQNKSATSESVTLSQLIDIYAVGRVQFRNTRQTIQGFPERQVQAIPLDADKQIQELVFKEVFRDVAASYTNNNITISKDDPRIVWLSKLISQIGGNKVLVICSTMQKAKEIQSGLQNVLNIDIAVFHEEMTLIQADRSAAWFSEENGAQVMISSDIGSEGRNFQFCSHLVLFDLPFNPELLEQRIGRLDRIGQKSTIKIYVPYITETPLAILAQWYLDGISSIQKNVPAAGTVFEEMRDELYSVLFDKQIDTVAQRTKTAQLIERAQKLCDSLSREIFQKRDRLLEIASFQPEKSSLLVNLIRSEDQNPRTKKIMEKLFKYYGIALEDAGENRLALLTEYVTNNEFPLPRQERPIVTYDRQTALYRDDVEFLTIDHPMVTGALELFLSSEHGTSSYVIWRDPQVKEIALESIFVLECIAPPSLQSDRFLPPLPVRVIVNQTGRNITSQYSTELLRANLKNGNIQPLLANKQFTIVISSMLKKSSELASDMIKPEIKKAVELMKSHYNAEIKRLIQLKEQGAQIQDSETEILCNEMDTLEKHLTNGRLRLSAVRLIRRGPQ